MMTAPKQGWQITRQLRQGVEIHTASGDERPHVPRVSLAGRVKVGELLEACSVTLDAAGGSGPALVEVAMRQLGAQPFYPRTGSLGCDIARVPLLWTVTVGQKYPSSIVFGVALT